MNSLEDHGDCPAASTSQKSNRSGLLQLSIGVVVLFFLVAAVGYFANQSGAAHRNMQALLNGEDAGRISRIVFNGQKRSATLIDVEGLAYLQNAFARAPRAGPLSEPRMIFPPFSEYTGVITFTDGSEVSVSICPFRNGDGYSIGHFSGPSDADETTYRVEFNGSPPTSVAHLMKFLIEPLHGIGNAKEKRTF